MGANRTGVTVRQIQVTELPRIVDVHIAAFPGYALAKLGKEAVRRFYEWQFTGPHDVVALGAYEEDELIGFIIAGVFRGAVGGFLRQNRGYLIRRVLLRPWLLMDPVFRDRLPLALRALAVRGKTRSRASLEVSSPKRRFGLLSLAVHPAHRGISALLLIREAEAIAIRLGFEEINHQVRPENARVAEMYRLLGYEKVFERDKWTGRLLKTLPARPTSASAPPGAACREPASTER
jgi:ribosomal protein S18 acetylase RimI-like enzyme